VRIRKQNVPQHDRFDQFSTIITLALEGVKVLRLACTIIEFGRTTNSNLCDPDVSFLNRLTGGYLPGQCRASS
jgi:hypothetical protein